VRFGARLQIGVLFLGLVPLALAAVAGLACFDARNLQPFAPHGWGALPGGMALIVWAYSGIESATVPAEEVHAPETTIRRSTMLGYAIGTVVYLALALAIAGALPNDAIAGSQQPLALLAERAAGPLVATVLSVTAVAACLGTLNGWILMSGRIPVSAAEDGLFFRGLARIHPRFCTPAVGLAVGTAIASAMLVLLLQRDFLHAFDFLVRLALVLTLVPHLFAAAADWRLSPRRRDRAVAAGAVVFVAFTIYGCGLEAGLWSGLAIAAGLPLYALFRRGARLAPGG
jgi:APA family basic amino acid/polyamine antiporter